MVSISTRDQYNTSSQKDHNIIMFHELICTINSKINGTPNVFVCPFQTKLDFSVASTVASKWAIIDTFGGTIYFAVDGTNYFQEGSYSDTHF